MKLTLASLLLCAMGASAVVTTPDSTTQKSKVKVPAFLESAYDQLKAIHGELTPESISAWEEVSKLYPEDTVAAIQKLTSPGIRPKKHVKRPDTEWDYIISGDELEKIMTPQGKRKISGDLKNKKLRIKKPNGLGIDPEVKQYSGYLDVDDDKHFFFWFFESRSDPENDPVVLWLNGGPGCSSLTGLFMELGPSWVDKKAEPYFNPYSWNSNSSVIFLDQPVNVGYSYSDGQTKNTAAAAEDVYAFLTLFFEKFPKYAKQDFHIAGESYAGHYIPNFASKILEHKDRNINLKSILIGNGLTDAHTQYAYYRPMACGGGGYNAILSPAECEQMDDALPRCQALIQSCYESPSPWRCVPATVYCNNAMMRAYSQTGYNVYDVREKCQSSNSLCYDEIGWVSTYLNKNSVMKAVGAEVTDYESCNYGVHRSFLLSGDWMLPFQRFIPDILKEIPVLVYAGDADFICNWLGNEAWTNKLEWKGHATFAKKNLKPYVVEDEEAGLFKSSGNFTFLRMYQAGHMVPYNQPKNSLAMLNDWIAGDFWATANGEADEDIQEEL